MGSGEPLGGGIILSLEKVSYRYPTGSKNVLSEISLNVGHGMLTAVIGPSESGKTTLLQFIAGITHAYYPFSHVTGDSILFGSRFRGQAPPLHVGKILYMHQEAGIQLSGMSQTVEEELTLSTEGLIETPMLYDIANAFSITHLLQRDPMTLSGGEQQRVALAAGYAMGPDILLLDEPALSLDENGVGSLLRMFSALHQRSTLLFSSKRYDRLAESADHILVLSTNGSCVASGTPAVILSKRDLLEDIIIFDIP